MRGNQNKSFDRKRNDSYNTKIQSTTDDLLERLQCVPNKHERVNESLKAIRSQGKRLINGSKMSQASRNKLALLYNTALKQCESEHVTLRNVLADIQKIRHLRFDQKMSGPLPRGSLMMLLAQHASSLPLYVGPIDGHPPPLVGAIPLPAREPLTKTDFVAAFVEDVWILAYIKEQISDKKYEIKDIDDENGDPAHKLVVHVDRLIPLPHYRADPRRDAHALFPRDAIVLALYPQTTCFYKGVVESSPAGPTDDYQIAFEDNTFPSGYSPTLPVAQRYVVTFRVVEGAVAPSTSANGGGGADPPQNGVRRGRPSVNAEAN